MAFGFAGAAAGGQDALQALLLRAFEQKQAEQQMAVQQQNAERQAAAQGLQEREFAANEKYRAGQVERQDTQAREKQNQTGVRRMIGDFLMQRGSQPLDQGARNQIAGMGMSEGIDVPKTLMEDPNLDHQNRLEEIAAQGKNSLAVANARDAQPSSGDYITLAGPDGSLQQVTKGPEANKLLGQGWKIYDTGHTRGPIGQERSALGFFNRAKNASDEIASSGFEEQYAKSGLMDQARGVLPNIVQSPQQQTYRQAQRAFTEARLRKESGAAVPPAEYENDARTYFAVPGDTDQVIAQKRQSRQAVLDGIAFQAGPAYEEYYGMPFKKNSAGVNPNPNATTPPPSGGGVQKWGRDAQGRPVRLQ